MYHDYASPIIRFGSDLPDFEARMKALQLLFDQKNYLRLGLIHGRDLYQTSSLLHSRIGVALTHFPFLRWLGRIVENQDRINRFDESSLTSDIDKYIAEQYTTPEQKRRARTIELAINNLAARATYSETPTIKRPEFRPTEEMLSIWATYWRADPLTSHFLTLFPFHRSRGFCGNIINYPVYFQVNLSPSGCFSFPPFLYKIIYDLVGIQRQNLNTLNQDMILQYLELEKQGYFANNYSTLDILS